MADSSPTGRSYLGLVQKYCTGCGAFVSWVTSRQSVGSYCPSLECVLVKTGREEVRDNLVSLMYTECNLRQQVIGELVGIARQHVKTVLLDRGNLV